MRRLVSTFSVGGLLVSGFAHAATILVPADQPTIQGGINAAVSGDTVLVAPGIYAEMPLIQVSAIVLKSEQGPSVTRIVNVGAGYIISILNTNFSTVVVSGFSVEGAIGTANIRILNSSAEISGNRILGGHEGGMYVSSLYEVVIRGNTFSDNTRARGAAIYTEFPAIIDSNVFTSNVDYDGGAAIAFSGAAQISRNVIYGNITNDDWGGMIYSENAVGFAIVNNTIVGNTKTSGGLGGVGIILLTAGPGVIRNNIVSSNLGQYGIQVYNNNGTTCDYNDVWSNGAQDYFNVIPGVGSISTDPLLSDTANSDFSLKSASPCVNSGHPDVLYLDSDGSRGDMGAVPLQCNLMVDSLDCDQDGVANTVDNCPLIANVDQEDEDSDSIGDGCDSCTDSDGDGFGNPGFLASTCQRDNCPAVANPDQTDNDADSIGDACDTCTDTDGDGFGNPGFAANTCQDDNCPIIANPSQSDGDTDSIGDACDNCVSVSNANQADIDSDGRGDACDNCPTITNANQQDSDGDGRGNVCDNCPGDFNPLQTDTDGDGIGDICDACLFDPANDADGDGICGNVDNCASVSNSNQADADSDGVGNVCDNCPSNFNPAQEETDGDGIADSCDNCPTVFNSSQTDVDGDSIGNACDICLTDPLNDPDADGVCNSTDNCPAVYNPTQADTNGNSIGDACDCACQCHADPVCDSVQSDVLDVVSTVNVAFRGAAALTDPSPLCPRERTDFNCSGATDVVDVVKAVNVAFRGANVATEYCEACP